MGIRELIDRKRKAILALLFIAVIAAVAWAMHTNSDGRSISPDGYRMWFTVDDGKSWFADDARQIPPFDHRGKAAVRCYVHRCSRHDISFVSHLLRYTPAGRKLQERLWAQKSFDPSEMAALQDLVEIKPPNTPETRWTKRSNPRTRELEQPTCPQGCVDEIHPVEAS